MNGPGPPNQITLRVAPGIKEKIIVAAAKVKRKLAPFCEELLVWAFGHYENLPAPELTVLLKTKLNFPPKRKRP